MATKLTEVIEGSRVLAANASIEATPDAILSPTSPRRTLACGPMVYVPFLPRADIADTVAACRQMAGIHVHTIGGVQQTATWLDASSVSAEGIGCAAHLPEPGTADRRAQDERTRFQPSSRRAEEGTEHAGTDQP